MANEDSEFSSDVLETFVQFLSKSSPTHVRGSAMQYLLGCTGTDEGMKFIGNNPTCLTSVIELTEDEEFDISRNAYKSLVNLAAELEISAKLASLPNFSNFVSKLMNCCLSEGSVHAYNACKVAANLSRWEECSSVIEQCLTSEHRDLSMYKVVESFSKAPEKREYLASFLSNMSCQHATRRLILDKSRCTLQRLLPLIQSESVTVRQGVVRTLRNCCFEVEYHEWLLSEAVDLLPRLLLPLAGPEEFDDDDMERLPDDLQYLGDDKKREQEAEIRKMLIETVNKLCATKICRQYVKDKNTYVIIRELDKWEQSPTVQVAIENLIQILISDEPEKGMENLNSVEIPEDVDSKLKKWANTTSDTTSQDTTSQETKI